MAIKHRLTLGFTLVELVVTMAIAAILVTVAIPGFSNLIRDNRLIASTNRLVTSLAHARSEAVKRGTSVSICASSNGTACTGSWTDGWLVFSDGGTTGTVDGTDTILRVEEGLRSDLAVSVSGDAVATFRATGFAVAACDAACKVPAIETPTPRSMLTGVIGSLLPGSAAYAGNGNGNGGGSGGSGGSGDGGSAANTAAVTTFTLCDSRSGETGRRISLWATGRIDTSAVTCGG